jgi:hypothetical protein
VGPAVNGTGDLFTELEMLPADALYYIGQDALAIVGVLGFISVLGGFVIRSFWRRVDQRVADLDVKATPNGKDTLSIGDSVARTEDKVDEVRQLLIAHLLNHPGGPAPPLTHMPMMSDLKPTRAEIETQFEEGEAE